MNKTVILSLLKISKEIYCIMSEVTRMQFVQCDPETFDDEILLFLNIDEANEKANELKKAGNPVTVIKIPQKHLLGFYSSLYPIGIDSLRVKMQYEPEMVIALDELVKRPSENELLPSQKRIENPAFHLTALYFIQLVKSANGKEKQEEAKQLSEEMTAHFLKGTYIMAVQDDGKIPLLRKKMGEENMIFHPVFTDMAEFMKFDRNKKFNPLIVEMNRIPKFMAKEAKGVIVNPVGVNLMMGVEKQSLKTE